MNRQSVIRLVRRCNSAVGILLARFSTDGSTWLAAAGWLFVAGAVLFSGSLYLLALTGITALGVITPIGGVAFLLGWACLALAASAG